MELYHAGQLLAKLAQLRHEAKYCDVFLKAENTASGSRTSDDELGVWAHRMVLAATSPFFYKMFYSSLDTCTVRIIYLQLDILRALVDNIYSATSLTVEVKEAKALLAAATMLEVSDVRDSACVCLASALAANNALGICSLAELYKCTDLAAAASSYIEDNYEDILLAGEFLELEFEALTALLKRERDTKHEEYVFDAVLRWIVHRPQSHDIQPHNTQLHGIKPRGIQSHDIQCPASLLVIGGGTTADSYSYSNTALVCSLLGGRWQSAAVLPTPRINAGAALVDGHVYVVGGSSGLSSEHTVFVYDAPTNSWSRGPSLNEARWWLGVAELDGRLYAAGGINSRDTFSSVEALDPREGVWKLTSPMSRPRGGLGVANLNGSLYAVGGHDGRMSLNSTERYDPRANRWELKEAMTELRMSVGVGVVDDVMYAVGGSDTSTFRSVERYREGWGWMSSPPMATARRGAAVTAYSGRLYAVGGVDDASVFTTVSVFDPATSLWSELAALPSGRWGAAAVVVAWL